MGPEKYGLSAQSRLLGAAVAWLQVAHLEGQVNSCCLPREKHWEGLVIPGMSALVGAHRFHPRLRRGFKVGEWLCVGRGFQGLRAPHSKSCLLPSSLACVG